MGQRLKLQSTLEAILGSKNVYFQPPDGLVLKYPAIVYTLDAVRVQFADDRPYLLKDRYQVTYIDRSPTSGVPREIQMLPLTRFTSYFVKDGLNHYNHAIYV